MCKESRSNEETLLGQEAVEKDAMQTPDTAHFGGFMRGVVDDYKRRLPQYGDDLTRGFTLKTISAALFMFLATFFSTVALGVLIGGRSQTDNRIGLEEYLIMNSVAGMAHAAFGCQPLLVLRPTGPITAILKMLSDLSDTFELDFWQFLAATGFFVGLYMTLVAGFELSRWIKHLTRFTHDIFAFFVCTIYIHDGITDMIQRFHSADQVEFGQSFFASMLAIMTFTVSIWLHGAPSWKTFNHCIRTRVFQDYAVTIAVTITVAVSYFWPVEEVERVSVPDSVTPTYLNNANRTRDWLVNFNDPPAPPQLWPLSALAAIPIVFFFYMDQNVSSLLTQQPHMGLTKGTYLHSSFLWMGIFNFIGPAFGLPFVTGSLPHSPQLVHALTNRDEEQRVVSVEENRLAPFLMYFLIGLPVLAPAVLTVIPQAAISGILIFVGVAGLFDCELWTRIICLLRTTENFPKKFAGLELSRIHLFTAIQLGLLAICWAVNLSPAGLLFSLCVVSIVPFRVYVMPKIFSDEELLVLDSDVDPVNDLEHGCRPRTSSYSFGNSLK